MNSKVIEPNILIKKDMELNPKTSDEKKEFDRNPPAKPPNDEMARILISSSLLVGFNKYAIDPTMTPTIVQLSIIIRM